MDRLVRFNVLAMSGRAVEAAATSTRCCSTRRHDHARQPSATSFRPLKGVTEQAQADAAQLASLADETPEGRSVVVLAKGKLCIRARDMTSLKAIFVPFTAQTA